MSYSMKFAEDRIMEARIKELKDHYELSKHPEGGCFCECYTASEAKDATFATENIDPSGYTFVSCVTAPKFSYEGFKLIGKSAIKEIYPAASDELLELAYEDNIVVAAGP